jgi:hypothetical protein
MQIKLPAADDLAGVILYNISQADLGRNVHTPTRGTARIVSPLTQNHQNGLGLMPLLRRLESTHFRYPFVARYFSRPCPEM